MDRLERVEQNLATLSETMLKHEEAANRRFEESNIRLTRLEEDLETMARSIVKYIDGSDARMTRMEQNLDLLIRAITTEHTNGKS